MHCKAFGLSENFDMHSLKQVYIYVISVELYCLNQVQRFVVIVLVPSLSPVTSPLARFRRSKPLSPWSAREVGDDVWGRAVSERVVSKWNFSIFRNG